MSNISLPRYSDMVPSDHRTTLVLLSLTWWRAGERGEKGEISTDRELDVILWKIL